MSAKGTQTQAALAQLWERNRGKIMDSVQTLEKNVGALLSDNRDASNREEATRIAHKLGGSLGTFGVHKGTEIARSIELLLEGQHELEPVRMQRLSELLVQLRSEVRQGVAPPEVSSNALMAPPTDIRSTLLTVVSDRHDLLRALQQRLDDAGIELQSTATYPALLRMLLTRRPDVLVLDLTAEDALRQAISTIGHLDKSLPVIALLNEAEPHLRVEVASLGADFCLPGSATSPQIVEAAQLLLKRNRARVGKILTVDDDSTITDTLELLLGMHGYDVHTLNDTSQFWTRLEEVNPDVLLLDIDMPGKSGLELCREVRSDPRWIKLPILFLTARRSNETIAEVFTLGADDYVSKPVIEGELATRVRNRLERVEMMRTMAETDALSGLASRAQALQRLSHFTELAARQGQPYSVALVALDGFKAINHVHGFGTGDLMLRRFSELLGRTFRGYDVMCRWSGARFLIGMYGLGKHDAAHLLGSFLEDLHAEAFAGVDHIYQITASAGLAQYPLDGTTVLHLCSAAEDAVAQARDAGGNRVWLSGQTAEQLADGSVADVVVVDDDEVLADLAQRALELRGYKVRWLKDGTDALGQLCGHEPNLRARLILLDIDMPGADGLTVLERMGADGVLEQTRVIMVTSRSDDETRGHLDRLGASAHIVKPFVLADLMRQVRETLYQVGERGHGR